MVYCSECGTENEGDTQYCVKCGANLRPGRSRIRQPEGRDMCFGLPHSGSIFGILIGLVIILVGARDLFNWNIDIGSYATIIVGILFVAGALYTYSQKKD